MRTDFYIYAHIDDRGLIYYIGKGQGNRCNERATRRSSFWNRYTKKYCSSGCPKVEILFDSLPESMSFLLETKWIKMLGRQNQGLGNLVNLTDGGEGTSGTVLSDESRQKISTSAKARGCSVRGWNKGLKASDETREKLRIAHLGQTPWNKGKSTGQIPSNIRSIRCNETGEIYKSIKAAAVSLKLCSPNISKVLAGNRKHAGGFTFSYINL